VKDDEYIILSIEIFLALIVFFIKPSTSATKSYYLYL